MDDQIRTLLEDAASVYEQHGDSDDLARRARGRHRRRVASGLLAGGLATSLGIGLTLSTIHFDGTAADNASPAASSPGPPAQQQDPPTLELEWSTEIHDTPVSAQVLMDRDRIFVPTQRGVVAYSVDCSDPCRPLWRSDIETASQPNVAAADGLVALISGDHGLFVFDAACATDGSICQPRWSVEGSAEEHWSSPSISDGIVRVTTGTGDMPQQHVGLLAFPMDCSGDCLPVWTADLGIGMIHGEVVDLDGVGYQQVGLTMYGFANACRDDGGVCEPDFEITSDGSPSDESSFITGPVGDKDHLIFSSGDGNVYAYAPACGVNCDPIWVGHVADFLDSSPVLGGTTVFVAGTDRIVGFPLRCSGTCPPSAYVVDDGYHSIDLVDEEGIVASSRFGRSRGIVSIASDCSGGCALTWAAEVKGGLYGVTADPSAVYAGVEPNAIAVYPRRCGKDCSATETQPVRGQAWWLQVHGDRLIVGARQGDPLATGITISVFRLVRPD
jgi:hypothetical protein